RDLTRPRVHQQDRPGRLRRARGRRQPGRADEALDERLHDGCLRARRRSPWATTAAYPGVREVTRPCGPGPALLRAAGEEAVDEAGEVVDVEHGRQRAVVAVGVRVPGEEAVEETTEVLDVQERDHGAAVAVGVADRDESPHRSLDDAAAVAGDDPPVVDRR